MESFSLLEFNKLRDGAEVLEQDAFGEKVLRTGDKSQVIKLFRCKRAISSAKFYPYAQRFYDNTVKLNELGVAAVKCEKVFLVPELERNCVLYNWQEGVHLRSLACEDSNEMSKFAIYLARLHEAGVYFRSLHFANVIVHKGNYILIDVSDMKIKKKSLGMPSRVRNFKSFLRYNEDKQAIISFGVERFLALYFDESKMSDFSKKMFMTVLKMKSKHPLNAIL